MTPMSFRLVNIESKQQKHKSPTYRTCRNALHLKKDMDLIVFIQTHVKTFFPRIFTQIFQKNIQSKFFFFWQKLKNF